MTQLNYAAKQELTEANIRPDDWVSLHPRADGEGYAGDECGCRDDRCIGHHHDADEACGCLPALIQDHFRQIQAEKDGADVWAAHTLAIESGDALARAAADAAVEKWVNEYHSAGLVSYSLTNLVDGRAGITITNQWNDQTWLVWDASISAATSAARE